MSRLGILTVALMAGSALISGARADRLDGQLNDKMDEIVSVLKKKYKTVGVLRFRVQQGKDRESFTSPLSGRMAERVEALLMIHNGPEEAQALALVRDVRKVASQKKIGAWYTDLEQRQKLFAQEYPRAWGSRMLRVDAFLTGKIELSANRKKTTVTLQCFDRENPATLRTLGTMVLDTDRFILRDLGASFTLSNKARERLTAKRGSLRDEDASIMEEALPKLLPTESEGKEPATPVRGEIRAEPQDIGGIKLELLVQDKPAAIHPCEAKDDVVRWQVESPPVGSEVAIRLRNTTEKRLAVVLRLNGVSTINEQRDDPETAAKWVILPGKFIVVRGFYLADVEGRSAELKRKKFTVLAGEEARAASIEMGDNKGLLEVSVFEEGPEKEMELLISPKGLPPSKEKEARSSYQGLRSAYLKSGKLKTTVVLVKQTDGLVAKREVIVPDKEVLEAGERVSFVHDFHHPRLIAHLGVRVLPQKGTTDGE